MKIMCLNAWGGKLYYKLLPYLKEADADILCLQEMVHTPKTKKDWLEYRDGDHILPQRANFFQDVQSVLTDYIGIFCPAAQGVLWDGDTPIPSQWGIATFVRKSYPLIGQIQGFVHKSYSPYDYGEHPRSRSAHGVKVFDYNGDTPVVIAHMHGLRDLNGKMDTPERTLQAHNLLSMVNGLAENNAPLVVCGDFNVVPNSETLKILSAAGLTDLVTTQTTRGTRNSHYKKKNRYADYMLVNEHTNVLDFNVIFEPEVSDHCPMILTI